MKIRGNTIGTPMKRPDFNQTDERKSDYIKNNPIPVINEGDEGKIPMVSGGAYVLEEKAEIVRKFLDKKADKYKRVQIDTFTTEEEAIIDKNYSSYNARGMYIEMNVPAGTVTNGKGISCYFITGSGNAWCGYFKFTISNGSAAYTGYAKCIDEYGVWVTEYYDNSQNTIKHNTISDDVNTEGAFSHVNRFCTQNVCPAGVTFIVTALLPIDEEDVINENT